jgi:hypothetical protein
MVPVLMLLLVAVAPGLAMADDVFSIGSSTYYVNGQAQTMDVAPYIENGRTMLPVRYVAEALGIPDSNISYDQSAQTVTIIDVGSSNGAIKLAIGSNIMSVAGEQVTMDTAPEIQDGRVFLPIHWIAQGLGASISWDPNNQQVTISGGGAPVPANGQPSIQNIQGMTVQDVTIGTGEAAENGDQVTVNYIGTLTNGTVFDSSFSRNQPFAFTIGAGQVIKGWDLGVVGMKVGGERKLVIPPSLGYGATGNTGSLIPPNATLNFTVDLLTINQ